MTFDEAMTQAAKGVRVRRAGWHSGVMIQTTYGVIFSEGGNHRRVKFLCSRCMDGTYRTPFGISDEDVAATDWEVLD